MVFGRLALLVLHDRNLLGRRWSKAVATWFCSLGMALLTNSCRTFERAGVALWRLVWAANRALYQRSFLQQ